METKICKGDLIISQNTRVDFTEVTGSVYVYENTTLQADNLTTIGGSVNVDEKATFTSKGYTSNNSKGTINKNINMETKNYKAEIKLPEGFEAANIEFKDGVLSYEVREKYVPKRGDVVVLSRDDRDIWISIFDSIGEGLVESFVDYDVEDDICDYSCGNTVGVEIRQATNEEKKLLFYKMREKGIEWDAEKMEVRKVFWKPKWYGEYWSICLPGKIERCTRTGDESNNIRLKANNYFKTEEEAQKYADEFARLLRERPL